MHWPYPAARLARLALLQLLEVRRDLERFGMNNGRREGRIRAALQTALDMLAPRYESHGCPCRQMVSHKTCHYKYLGFRSRWHDWGSTGPTLRNQIAQDR